MVASLRIIPADLREEARRIDLGLRWWEAAESVEQAIAWRWLGGLPLPAWAEELRQREAAGADGAAAAAPHLGILRARCFTLPIDRADSPKERRWRRERARRALRRAQLRRVAQVIALRELEGAGHARQDGATEWLRDIPSVSWNRIKCGRVRVEQHVDVRIHEGERWGYLRGVATCGSWYGCPVCAERRAGVAAEEVRRAVEAHRADGGDVLMLTLTLRHAKAHGLKELTAGLAEAWRKTRWGKAWFGTKRANYLDGWRARIGEVGTIRAIDCTHGPYGWHVHYHILILTDRPLPARELVRFRRWLRSIWPDRVARYCGEAHRPDPRIGVHLRRVRDAEGLAQYLAKVGTRDGTAWGPAAELAGAAYKRGRTDRHRTPLQILADYARSRRSEDRALWLEWCGAMRGRPLLAWTRGLAERLIGAPAESSAEESDAAASGEFLAGRIPGREWDRLRLVWDRRGRADLGARLVAAGIRWGPGGVDRLLSAARRAELPERLPERDRAWQAQADAVQHKIRWRVVARESAEELRALQADGAVVGPSAWQLALRRAPEWERERRRRWLEDQADWALGRSRWRYMPEEEIWRRVKAGEPPFHRVYGARVKQRFSEVA